jgi:hypothetical protein
MAGMSYPETIAQATAVVERYDAGDPSVTIDAYDAAIEMLAEPI